MKYPLIIVFLFLSVIVGQQEYNIKNLLIVDGFFVKKFSDVPINGKVFQIFDDIKVPLGMIENGKKEGKWIRWYKNGRKKDESTYKDGELNGLVTSWYKNGQKKGEGFYKDGEPDGLITSWYKNGRKKNEYIFQNGKLISNIKKNKDGSVKE